MTKEKINEYTLRISQANRSEIIVILYDMALQYIEDAREAVNGGSHEEFRANTMQASKVVNDLIGAVEYNNELAVSLLQLYNFIQGQLSLAVIKNREDELNVAKRLLSNLRESFAEVAKADTSKPIMGNSETVYAGLTYGRKAVYDSLTTEVKRGYTV